MSKQPAPRNIPSTTLVTPPQITSVEHVSNTLTTVPDATGDRSTVEALLSVPSLQVPTSDTSSVTFAAPLANSNDPAITESLLNVISDKTGYPAEMLEMEMDLEADLGIDSIKWAEIMGAMQQLFPSLPKLTPEELGEQRTIGLIAEYLGTKIAEAKKKCLS